MADTPSAPAYKENDDAPFIYFDLAPTYGQLVGAIQVELGARVISPTPDGGTSIYFTTVARLRCSPMAAESLRDALTKALDMFNQPEQAPTSASIN